MDALALVQALRGGFNPFQLVGDGPRKPMPFETGGGAGVSNVYVPRGYGEQTQAPSNLDLAGRRWIPFLKGKPYDPEVVPDQTILDPNLPVAGPKQPRQQGSPEFYETGVAKPGSSPRYLEQKARRLKGDSE